MSAVDAQLIKQLQWTDEKICAAFGVPAYMAGVGAAPSSNNVEALARQYYQQALQIHIESIEICLDEGLNLKRPLGTEFDLDDLLRMDQATMADVMTKLTGGAILSSNEARKRFNQPPVTGGESPLAQQQNYSLAALAKRDAKADPFATSTPPKPTPPEDDPEPDDDEEEDAADDTDGDGEETVRLILAIQTKFARPVHA
jgi:phage portal protein BeeE